MKISRTLLAIAAFGVAACVFADDYAGSTYLYGDIGQARYHGDVASGLGAGATVDKTHVAGGIGVGYKFSPNFAFETGYLNLGKATAHNGTASSQYRAQGVALQAVGTLPLNDRFGIYGAAGLNPLHVKADLNGTSDNKWRAVPSLGLGVTFKATDEVGLRAGYSRYFNTVNSQGVKLDVDVLSLGVTYAFK